MVALPLSRYRFRFIALDRVRLPVFAGSAWRGAFGTALKRTVCATRLHSCDPCPLVDSCSFPYLFLGRRPQSASGLAALGQVPVPYLFQPEPDHFGPAESGSSIVFDMVLVGRADAHLLYVIYALAAAGSQGIGPGRGRLILERVERLSGLQARSGVPVYLDGQFNPPGPEATPDPAPPPPAGLQQVEILTPLRLKLDGHLVTPDKFRPAHLADAAIRRISSLSAFHADAPIAADYRGLKALAALLTMHDSSLHWDDWKRRSSRQGQTMSMGGIRGRFTMRVPEESVPLLSWLELGQWVGIGKGASMGLGQVRLSSSAVPASADVPSDAA